MPSATIPSKDQGSCSPPAETKRVSTSYLRRDRPPPLQFCAEMNANIRSNPIFDSPYFDLAGHIGSRAYCMHNVEYASGSDETAALLDIGVKDLLPLPIPAPPVRSPKGTTFAIRATSDGKNGLGMFAAKNIPAGGLILVERPVLVAPYVIGLPSAPESVLYAALLRRLSPETVARFMALENSQPEAENDVLEGIVRTNALAITLPVPAGPHPELATHRAVFLHASRCNHSCGPNARWRWDPESFSLSLAALRPIAAGQEITVAYISPLDPRAARRAQLRAQYAFSCRCAHCALPHALRAKSDAARAELRAFDWEAPAFADWCADARMPDGVLIDAHARAVALIEQEGLEGLDDYARHIDAVAMGYGALGDVKQFRAWTWRARDSRPAEDNAAARVLQKWIREPETFPVWGWRREMKAARAD